MGRKKIPGFCKACGGTEGRHKLTCRQNRCPCGMPALLDGMCTICFAKSRKAQRTAAERTVRNERARIVAERLQEFDRGSR
jgi:hypothetical protein